MRKTLTEWLKEADEAFNKHVASPEARQALRTLGMDRMSNAERLAWKYIWKHGWLRQKAKEEDERAQYE